ncbi:hypothetical protein [Humidisolicoccus flavus]|uniref:hypothetical protein n=1 Tax=Humidisolicoccus flavus TaxID=3111414 RepID=UPI003249AD4D
MGEALRSDAVTEAKTSLDRIVALRSRIQEMQSVTLDTKALPTISALQTLLPGGALQAGSSYSVQGSMMLAMSMLAATSAAGSWCAVVGVEGFGAHAAAGYGIDLSRLVLVPNPGKGWVQVTAALADIVTLVLVRPSGNVTPSDAARLHARLRQRGSSIIALGSWPNSETQLRVTESHWTGLGEGHGFLQSRHATVHSSRGEHGRATQARLMLPNASLAAASTPPVSASPPVSATPPLTASPVATTQPGTVLKPAFALNAVEGVGPVPGFSAPQPEFRRSEEERMPQLLEFPQAS